MTADLHRLTIEMHLRDLRAANADLTRQLVRARARQRQVGVEGLRVPMNDPGRPRPQRD